MTLYLIKIFGIPVFLLAYSIVLKKSTTADRIDRRVNSFLKENVFPKELSPASILKAGFSYAIIPFGFFCLGVAVEVAIKITVEKIPDNENTAYYAMVGAFPFITACFFSIPLIGYIFGAFLTALLPNSFYSDPISKRFGVEIGFRRILLDSIYLSLAIGSYLFFNHIEMPIEISGGSVLIWTLFYWLSRRKYFGQ